MQSVIHRICLWLLTLMTCFRHRMKLSASHSCFPSHLSTELPGHLQHEIFHRPTVRPVQPILWGRVVRESPRHLVWRKIPYYLNTAWWKTHLLHYSCKLWHHTVPRNQHKSGCYIFFPLMEDVSGMPVCFLAELCLLLVFVTTEFCTQMFYFSYYFKISKRLYTMSSRSGLY